MSAVVVALHNRSARDLGILQNKGSADEHRAAAAVQSRFKGFNARKKFVTRDMSERTVDELLRLLDKRREVGRGWIRLLFYLCFLGLFFAHAVISSDVQRSSSMYSMLDAHVNAITFGEGSTYKQVRTFSDFAAWTEELMNSMMPIKSYSDLDVDAPTLSDSLVFNGYNKIIVGVMVQHYRHATRNCTTLYGDFYAPTGDGACVDGATAATSTFYGDKEWFMYGGPDTFRTKHFIWSTDPDVSPQCAAVADSGCGNSSRLDEFLASTDTKGDALYPEGSTVGFKEYPLNGELLSYVSPLQMDGPHNAFMVKIQLQQAFQDLVFDDKLTKQVAVFLPVYNGNLKLFATAIVTFDRDLAGGFHPSLSIIVAQNFEDATRTEGSSKYSQNFTDCGQSVCPEPEPAAVPAADTVTLDIGGLVWADIEDNLAAVKTSLTTDISAMLGVAPSAILNLDLRQSTLLSGVICTFDIAADASATQTAAELSQTLKETLANDSGQFTSTATTTGKTVTATTSEETTVSSSTTGMSGGSTTGATGGSSTGTTGGSSTGTTDSSSTTGTTGGSSTMPPPLTHCGLMWRMLGSMHSACM